MGIEDYKELDLTPEKASPEKLKELKQQYGLVGGQSTNRGNMMTIKEALEMSSEEFKQRFEKQEEEEDAFVDKALEEFVRKTEESNWYSVKKISFTEIMSLLVIFCVIMIISVVSRSQGIAGTYGSIAIEFISLIGIVIVAKIQTKK